MRKTCWCGGRETDGEEDVLVWWEGDSCEEDALVWREGDRQ